MKRKILTIILSLLVFQTAMAQTATDVRQVNPADVSSIDAIMKAVYDVISGEAGKPRDWARFRTLFHKDARIIPSGKNPQTGTVSAHASMPEEYMTRSSPFMEKEGFF